MATSLGPISWSGNTDKECYTDYEVVYRVRCLPTEGPHAVMNAAGLPVFGDWYNFSADEQDNYAWCRRETSAKPALTAEPNTEFEVTKHFSTRPPGATDRPCVPECMTDPLLEPDRISGRFLREKKEYTEDQYGNPLKYSSHEPIRGEQVKFASGHSQVKIVQNMTPTDFDLTLLISMQNCVNENDLWDNPPRCVMLADFDWERKFWGDCEMYITRTLTFDINPDTFDRKVIDQGTLALSGYWEQTGNTITPGGKDVFTGKWILRGYDNQPVGPNNPNPNNPRHFIRLLDQHDKPVKRMLNKGVPAGSFLTGKYCVAIVGGAQDIGNEYPGLDPAAPGQWVPIYNDDITVQVWDDTANAPYFRGEMLSYLGDWYVVIRGGVPNLTDATQANVDWVDMGAGAGPTAQGPWDDTTNYNAGDLVQLTEDVKAGEIPIEVLKERNFELLNIPLDLFTW